MENRDQAQKQTSLQASLLSAVAFQHLAETFIGRIGTEVPEGTLENWSPTLGPLIASAVNLAFALELYLKTLLALLHQGIPKHHDLRNLFDALPTDARTEIEGTYEACWRSRWLGDRASITLAVGQRDLPQWTQHRESPALSALLDRSRNVFQTWRYIFEVEVPAGSAYQFHQFEYGLLICACDSLRAAIKATARRSQGPLLDDIGSP